MSHTNPDATRVFGDWLRRQSEGDPQSFEDLVQKHPDHASDLQRIARGDAMLEQLGMPRREERSDSQKTLGDFRLIRQIARGGMGIVYEAEQISLGRRVAIKVLPAHLTLDERALTRFRREAEVTSRLRHTGIVDIFAIGEEDGVHFIAMELVEGTSLDKLIERMQGESFDDVRKRKIADAISVHGLDEGGAEKKEPSSGSGSKRGSKGSSSASNKNYVETAVKLIIQVADALQFAHDAGVVHRDIKPSNILVRSNGSAVLTDFGLAREEGLPSVSVTGDFAGTMQYVSPEQAMAGRVPLDHRSDVFSLGATLYELLTLERAFEGPASQILAKIISKEPTNPSRLNPILHPDLVTVVLSALEKDPDRRYQSAAEFAADLRAFLEYRPISRKAPSAVSRVQRWCKREPMKASLVGLLAVGVPIVSVLSVSLFNTKEVAAQLGQELSSVHLEEALNRAYMRLGFGNNIGAAEGFRDLVEQNPSSADARAGLVLALLANQEHAEAEQILNQAPAGTMAEDALQRLAVDVLQLAGRESEADALAANLRPPQTALTCFLEALRLLRDSPIGRLRDVALEENTDTLLVQEESARQALVLLDRAISLAPSQRPTYHYARAWAAFLARDETQAATAAQAIQLSWPQDPLALLHAGLALEVVDTDEAAAAYAKALQIDPEFSLVRERQALLMLEEDPEGAIAALQDLTQSDPDPAYLANLAVAFFEMERYEEAIRAAKGAVGLDPLLVEPYDTLGTAHYHLGQHAEALGFFDKALELEPTGARLHSDRGVVLMELKRMPEARQAFERAIELGLRTAKTLYNCGTACMHVGETDLAIGYLEESLEFDDTNPKTHAHIGQCFQAMGEIDASLAAYEVARDLGYQDWRHHHNLVNALQNAGRGEELHAALDRWLEDQPENCDARFWKAHASLGSDPSLALEFGEAAAEACGELTAERHLVLCLIFEANGRDDEALEQAALAMDRLELEPDLDAETRGAVESTFARLEEALLSTGG